MNTTLGSEVQIMTVANFSIEDIQVFFPKLEIKNVIGRGGQKQVFKALLDDKIVALKIIILKKDKNIKKQLKRISRELKAMINVKSPHLVELLAANFIAINGEMCYYYIEDFIEGDNLRDLIVNKKNDFTKKEFIQIGKCLLLAAEELWKFGIVHRDIKPENIIITEDKKACLLDLGIAQFKDDSTITIPFFGRGPGTSGYMAPELLNYDKELQSIRTDIFSIGITLIESYTGKHPFDIANSENSRDENILMEKKSSFKKYFKNESCLFDSLDMMINYHPYERPTNAKKAIENLERCLENE